MMEPEHIEDAQEMYAQGHTFYAIAYQLKQWFQTKYTKAEIAKALGKEDNPIGHPKFRQVGD